MHQFTKTIRDYRGNFGQREFFNIKGKRDKVSSGKSERETEGIWDRRDRFFSKGGGFKSGPKFRNDSASR